MARPKKNGTYLNVCIETPIYERLEKLCEDAGQTKTVAVERALNLYLDDYEEKQRILDTVSSMYARIIERGDCLSLRDLAVNGSDLIELGVKPGREVGTILAQMLDDVLNVPDHNDKEYLVKRFANIPG